MFQEISTSGLGVFLINLTLYVFLSYVAIKIIESRIVFLPHICLILMFITTFMLIPSDALPVTTVKVVVMFFAALTVFSLRIFPSSKWLLNIGRTAVVLNIILGNVVLIKLGGLLDILTAVVGTLLVIPIVFPKSTSVFDVIPFKNSSPVLYAKLSTETYLVYLLWNTVTCSIIVDFRLLQFVVLALLLPFIYLYLTRSIEYFWEYRLFFFSSTLCLIFVSIRLNLEIFLFGSLNVAISKTPIYTVFLWVLLVFSIILLIKSFVSPTYQGEQIEM